jgi:hypothetical protein
MEGEDGPASEGFFSEGAREAGVDDLPGSEATFADEQLQSSCPFSRALGEAGFGDPAGAAAGDVAEDAWGEWVGTNLAQG